MYCRHCDGEIVGAARLVCRAWRDAVTQGFRVRVKPRSIQTTDPLAKLGAATELDLTDAPTATPADVAALPQLLPGVTALHLECR